MIKIYTQCRDGKHLIATVETINQVEPFFECCRNVVTEDVEMSDIIRDLPEVGSLEDDALSISYGVDPRAWESAIVFSVCACLMPVLILIAYLTQ